MGQLAAAGTKKVEFSMSLISVDIIIVIDLVFHCVREKVLPDGRKSPFISFAVQSEGALLLGDSDTHTQFRLVINPFCRSNTTVDDDT